MTKDFNIPTQVDKNAIFTEEYEKNKTFLKLKVDSNIHNVTGLLALPILSVQLLQQYKEKLISNSIIPTDKIVVFVFVSRDVLIKSHQQFMKDNERTYFLNIAEIDKFLLNLYNRKIIIMENIDHLCSSDGMLYMEFQDNTLGCFVNEGQKNKVLRRLNDVTTVDRLLCIKKDIKLCNASSKRLDNTKKHIGTQVYSNMQQSDRPIPSPSRGPKKKLKVDVVKYFIN